MTGTAHTIPELDRKGLRDFGLLTGGIVAVLFGLFFPWLLGMQIPQWPWIVASVLVVWALLAPNSLRPFYKLWMRLGLLLSRITTPIVLGVAFYGVFLPVALVLKVLRHDPMSRKLDDNIKTYRIPSRKTPPGNMERPF